MARSLLALFLMAAGAAGLLVYQRLVPVASSQSPGGGAPGGQNPFQPRPLLVETATVSRADVAEELQIVGNLVGDATIEVAPKVNGRLTRLDLRLGDQVFRGQEVAWVEDDELRLQVSQAEASYEVARATVRQREADLRLAETSRDRLQSLFDRELVSSQELDDGVARFQAASAQIDLARAQFDQAAAFLEELRVNLAKYGDGLPG